MFNINANIEKFTTPFNWINITNLFTDGNSLVDSYPTDSYRNIMVNSKERQYDYDVRAIVRLNSKVVENRNLLDPHWQKFADYVISDKYRQFVEGITGIRTANLPIEVNLFKYSKNCFMDAHQDLNTKVITQVVYFNKDWQFDNGGCLNILNSKDVNDVHKRILPVIGNSVIIIRSENSWHSVETTLCDESRRSVTITFYKTGSQSPMWTQPTYALHTNSK